MSSQGKELTIQQIKERLRVVCICKGIKAGKICDAIQRGAKTLKEVHKNTGSGGGGCGETRCGPVITELIQLNGNITAFNARTQKIKEEEM